MIDNKFNICGKNDIIKRCPKCESTNTFKISPAGSKVIKHKCCGCRNEFGEGENYK